MIVVTSGYSRTVLMYAVYSAAIVATFITGEAIALNGWMDYRSFLLCLLSISALVLIWMVFAVLRTRDRKQKEFLRLRTMEIGMASLLYMIVVLDLFLRAGRLGHIAISGTCIFCVSCLWRSIAEYVSVRGD